MPERAEARPRDLGVRFDGEPGPWNAITDVAGVAVGHTTLVSGEGKLTVGQGPVRTGVTAILPRREAPRDPVFAAWYALNGNGDLTGALWLRESGFLEGPLAITNTHSVGVVRNAIIAWQVEREALLQPWSQPVVAETYDGWLNDVNGFHVRREHVFAALDNAASGPVVEGNVGGGTGMMCYGFKGGIGTASRRLTSAAGGWTLGVLAQCNFGTRDQLRIDGVPIGRLLQGDASSDSRPDDTLGSIVVVVATNAPLLPHQLERIARRVPLGIARTGATSANGSGDIFIAFSTANPGAGLTTPVARVGSLANPLMNPLFDATVQTTEEAILNALFAARTMVGRDDHRVEAIPIPRVLKLLPGYG